MKKLNAERKTLIVIFLTLITMFVEIFVGYFCSSMALFADGWHMGTHALALSLTYFTYILIRKFSSTDTFVFGTGKFSSLAGYTSSILLGLTGFIIIGESIERFIHPLKIGVNEALIVAIIGFLVNSFCILIMGEHNHSHSGHEHHHCECKHHEYDKKQDYNFKAAYMHILADAMTSVFAIIALLAAKYMGWIFLDPIVGLIGGSVICIWAYDLIKSTGSILLDKEIKELKETIKEKLADCVEFETIHIWKVSEDEYALISKLKSELSLTDVKSKLSEIANFTKIVIEKV